MHHRRLLIFLIYIAISCAGFSSSADPTNLTLNVIYSFTNEVSPNANLVQGSDGNFYGTTATGGPSNFGGIFEVTTNGVLTKMIWLDGTNGAAPVAPLIEDGSGNFYGTASSGGFQSNGTIFRITQAGDLQLLVSFKGTNGSQPLGSLFEGANGWFYGTTFGGGSNNQGLIFRMNADGFLTNQFAFDGSDGANPGAGLIQGNVGTLYGTTEYGGASGLGTVFKFVIGGTLTNLSSFTDLTGAFPGGLVENSTSNFFGATINGGADFAGTIFELGPFGGEQTLFTFNINNGANPNSPLTPGHDGSWYGTTEEGGNFGAGTIFRLDTRGFLSTLVSFDGPNGALPRSGLIQGTDGNFYGTTTQGGAYGFGEVYQLTGFAPVIVTPPANLKWASNSTAQFVVVAAGSAPLSYQWMFDGTNDIPGATNANLVVSHEQLTNSGTYTVVISNAYGVVVSSNAVLSVTAPNVAIVAPPATVTNAALTISGTASSPVGIGSVLCQLNGNGWFAPSGTTHWQTTVSLQPGENTFQAQSFDPIGNPSVIKSITTFYSTISPLTLETNGLGSITTSFKGTNLVVERSYTVRAVPGKGQLFLSWSGSEPATANPLTFVMQSNMVIEANFVTNPFIAAAGIYDGLFFDTNSIGEQSSGLLSSLNIESSGAYSGAVVIKGLRHGFTGSFNVAAEQSTPIVARIDTQGGPLALNMTLGANEVTGTISGNDDGGWTSPLLAERISPFSGSAEYTMLLAFLPPGVGSPSSSPPGYGYALVTNHNGFVTLSGAVADGAAFSQGVSVVGAGDVPFYVSLYNNTGLLLGWLNVNGGLSANNLWWVKTSSKAALYPNGFTNSITDIPTSAWTEPPASYLTDGSLTVTEVSYPMSLSLLDFIVSITNSTLLKETGSTTNSLAGIFYPKTGLLQITFGNGAGKATTKGYAAILGDSTNGGGYFVTGTNAGTITLTP
jgi:uncharacterized repeat protein (TIGR03803 family)